MEMMIEEEDNNTEILQLASKETGQQPNAHVTQYRSMSEKQIGNSHNITTDNK
jgi:hypothetical protein